MISCSLQIFCWVGFGIPHGVMIRNGDNWDTNCNTIRKFHLGWTVRIPKLEVWDRTNISRSHSWPAETFNRREPFMNNSWNSIRSFFFWPELQGIFTLGLWFLSCHRKWEMRSWCRIFFNEVYPWFKLIQITIEVENVRRKGRRRWRSTRCMLFNNHKITVANFW